MKTISHLIKHALALFCIGVMFAGCSDEVTEENLYTFTGDTVTSYCQSDSKYSTFSNLLKDTGKTALLASYGHYTCFLPSDEAFDEYFRASGKTYDDLSREEKEMLLGSHVIRSMSTDFTSEHFEVGSLKQPNMNNDYITISFEEGLPGESQIIHINKTATVLEKDIEVHNGVIHTIDRVLTKSEEYLLTVLEADGRFKLFSEAFRLTGLDKKTEPIYDESYVCPYPSGEYNEPAHPDWAPFKVPLVKRYGFTVFAESDEVMGKAGISNIDDLVRYAEQYYGTEARGNYTSPDNALNRFVAYHLLDRQMSTNNLLYNGPLTPDNFMFDRKEYYETMYTYRLMEVKAGKAGHRINMQRNGQYVGINDAESNIAAVNGFAHSLTSMLVFDEEVMVNDVLNKRIRFDFYNVPPELTNNNIRWMMTDMGYYGGYKVDTKFCGKHLIFNDETEITMFANNSWNDFEADELVLTGWYDFRLRLLPVPPGSYEIRLGYAPASWRGIVQLFIDDQIQGIPRDLRITGRDPQVGWYPDTYTTLDAENDKAMRNHGFMKGPASVGTNDWNLRGLDGPLRIIVGQVNFQDWGEHYLRGKNVYDPGMWFHGDYIEIIPTSLIDTEDIY